MHVCFPLPPIERYAPSSGGAIATCVMQVARGLIERGHRVTVLADNRGDEPYDVGEFRSVSGPHAGRPNPARRALSKLRYRLHRYDWPRQDLYVAAVRRAIASLPQPPDVIAVENDLHTPGLLKRALPRAASVLWLHNEQHPRHPRPTGLLAPVDRVVTNSHYIRRFSQRRLGLDGDRIAVVHNGVDLEAFTPRVGYLEPRAPVRVLALGRIDPNKGVDLAVDAVAALRERGVAVSITVVGARWFYGDDGRDDPFTRSLRAKMDAAGADYLGHRRREDVPALVREHDVACVLSRSQEPFGLVALEAMAGGCAVVASDRGGLPEACGGAAVSVDVDRFDAVVEAVHALATDPDRLASAKRAAVARAAGMGWDRTAREMERVMLEAIRRRAGREDARPAPPVTPQATAS